ncbi:MULTISPECIES: mechanosensitive ion channel family protein [unclassified Coleofasciculus]|uniref:mechanosensitive ion channel family protein n=1 Tax=unclassified Coleofasciculus TaxID=2692782 RepID=UPI001882666C|nr:MULTISPECIES: mechanosensitive ion channel domain-containing protein [unclassified Coleofasciculus]MBE9125346.1 mechanosensitive ion channel [Coleofasciculus sp. LEGE 07081]MBE9148549.1 mechanosensitive ion channel [Coleofasciculus sp. LEGE 07092]
MNASDLSNTISKAYQSLYFSSVPNYVLFLIFALLSILIGRYTPSLTRFIIHRFSIQQGKTIYDNLIDPIQKDFKVAGTLILLSFSLAWLEDYQGLYEFLSPFMTLAVTISVAWLASRLFRQFVRVYGIDLIRRFGREVDELLLVFETIANVIIGFIAVVTFAQSQNVNLVGLLASFGIGGIAIAFAAQQTLQQLLGTIVLYLDRPFIPGEYIRLPDGSFGRVESIGLRSTKIRTAAKSTLLIVPNSKMADWEIENVTRGKKVMVLLYLDFYQVLQAREQALVQQIIVESTDSLFGIDPGSTNITLINSPEEKSTRARITFFILGSSDNSIQLRKRLLELANDKISKKLMGYGIAFKMNEPTIYVDSPMTI